MTKYINRHGIEEEFNGNKIYQAILKAMKYGSGMVDEQIAKKIAEEIHAIVSTFPSDPTIFQIETYVYLKLIENGENRLETALKIM